MITINRFETMADAALSSSPEGPPLDETAAALIRLGCAASVCSLHPPAIEASIQAAFTAGATTAQVQEIVALISGLGVHSLMMSAASILAAAEKSDADIPPWDDQRHNLWQQHVGDDPYWAGFEEEFPGFLRALLQLSPAMFEGFFAYCAIPWKSGTVPALVKELAAMSSDATPSHRFGPGFRLHLKNAIALGAGKAMIRESLQIAAQAPLHQGIA